MMAQPMPAEKMDPTIQWAASPTMNLPLRLMKTRRMRKEKEPVVLQYLALLVHHDANEMQ